MEVHISLTGRAERASQIYWQLREAILDGRVQPGDPLPPSRELASRLGVARNTVIVAYDRLSAEGYTHSRVGSGTFISSSGRPAHTLVGGSSLRPRPRWETINAWPDEYTGPARIAYDFRVGVPDATLFPTESWRRELTREHQTRSTRAATYDDPAGHAPLRAAISRHIGISRAVRTGPGDIVVTNGVQQALDLISRVMIDPGDRVAIEDPGYPPARLLFESMGAEIRNIPVDSEGLDVDAIPIGTRLVYVTPSHQFPLGMSMSLRRRTALLEWAQQHGALIIEDDYDSEFRFGHHPIEPIQSLDRAGHVVYLGSFSKVLTPSLRLGFLVAPAPLRDALRTAKFVTDWHTPEATQAALARFIDKGLLARHIRTMRRTYQPRHEMLTSILTGDLAHRYTLVPSSAGLHLAAFTTGELADEGELAAMVTRLRADGVAINTLADVARSHTVSAGLVFGYGAITASDIRLGMRHLR